MEAPALSCRTRRRGALSGELKSGAAAAMDFPFDRWTVHAPLTSRLKWRDGLAIGEIDGAACRMFMVNPDSPTWMRRFVEECAFHFGNEGGYELI